MVVGHADDAGPELAEYANKVFLRRHDGVDGLVGLRRLVAPALRPGFDPVMRALGRALGAWVGAQLLAMAIVGGLTFLGLTLIGMPLAGILAVLAALLGFIPIIGPIIAWVPAVLLAAGEGWTVVLWVSGLYLLIQVVEGVALVDGPAFSVQYHPEAAAGPHDAAYLFDRFVQLMADHAPGHAGTAGKADA